MKLLFFFAFYQIKFFNLIKKKSKDNKIPEAKTKEQKLSEKKLKLF